MPDDRPAAELPQGFDAAGTELFVAMNAKAL
jgi:hypothetical protein